MNARIPGGGKTNITFASSATNMPTITIGSGSRPISHLYLKDDGSSDAMGIRVSGSALSYFTGNSSAWTGAGILNKPIGDFFTGTFDNRTTSFIPTARFVANSNGSVRVVVHRAIIPEPKEYALVFALFALGFVIIRRHCQKKH